MDTYIKITLVMTVFLLTIQAVSMALRRDVKKPHVDKQFYKIEVIGEDTFLQVIDAPEDSKNKIEKKYLGNPSDDVFYS